MLVLAAVLCAVQPSSAVVTEVNTQYGRIKGTYDAENKLVIYFGVPYAAPPVGSLRLQPPQVRLTRMRPPLPSSPAGRIEMREGEGGEEGGAPRLGALYKHRFGLNITY